jgi:group I intron endonuclease
MNERIDLVKFWEPTHRSQPEYMCVYSIVNLVSNNFYIGSTKNLRRRMHLHIRMLRKNHHHSIILQRSFNKRSIEVFQVEILEKVEDANCLLIREQYYLDLLKPTYNVAKIAGSTLGVKKSDETKEKLRKAILGVKHPQWRNELKSRVQLGKKHKGYSDESKLHCSEAQKRLYQNGYVSPNKGRKASEEELLRNRLKSFKAIVQLTLNGKFIKKWDSAIIVQETLGFFTSNIVACCTGRKDKAYGFRWAHADSGC